METKRLRSSKQQLFYLLTGIFTVALCANAVFAIAPDPLASLKNQVHTALSAASDPTPTGFDSDDYLETIDGIVQFFRGYQQADGRIFDPYRGNEVQYSTPYYALCGSVLYAQNYRSDQPGAVITDTDFLESVALALDRAAWELYNSSAADGHSNFFTMPCMIAYWNLKNYVAPSRVATWDNYLTSMSTSQYGTCCLNWMLTASTGDYLRWLEFEANGSYNIDTGFMETRINENMSQWTLEGLYRDGGYPYSPMAYDGFGRLNFQILDLYGYTDTGFPGAADIHEYNSRGAWTSMLMQSPWGEMPLGGRSAQHQWNETEMCFIYERWAAQAKADGDMVSARAFKRAARLSYRSLRRWIRPEGYVHIVKNNFDPSVRWGYESYSYLSQYNMWTAGFLSLACMQADETITEGPAPADIGGFAFEIPDLHKGFANCGGLYLQVDTDPEDNYDITGLMRIHKAGVEPLVSPSAPTTHLGALNGIPELGTGVGWYTGSGWHSLADVDNNQIASSSFNVTSTSGSQVDFSVTYNFDGTVPGATSVTENYSVTPIEATVNASVNGTAPFVKMRYAAFLNDGERDFTVGYDDGLVQTKLDSNLMTMELTSHPTTPFDRTFSRVNSRNGYLESIEGIVSGQSLTYVLRPQLDPTGTGFTATNTFTGLDSGGITSYTIVASEAGSEQTNNWKENSYDDNETTRWCNDGYLSNPLNYTWIKYDLGSAQTIGKVNLLLYRGTTRTYPLSIEVSTDGTTWNSVFNGWTSTSSGYWETVFTPVSGRYVRLTMTANNSEGGSWFSIYETKISNSDGISAPSAPAGLTATAGDLAISLNWDDNTETNLASYNVKRAVSPGGPYTTIASDVLVSNYMDSDVTYDTPYYYVVSAVNTSSSEGPNSNETSGTPTNVLPPSAPSALSAQPDNGSVTLDWADNAETDIAGYKVYRSMISGGEYLEVASGLTVSNYVDTSVVNGVTYYYAVTAIDTASNESTRSSEVSTVPAYRVQKSIISSTAGSEESGNPAVNSYDSNETTRWCNDGSLANGWIQYDLGSVQIIDQIKLLYFNGHRIYPIRIEVSTNGANWTEVFAGDSGQMNANYWQSILIPISGRYVKISLTASNSDGNYWFSIYEAQIWGSGTSDITPPAIPTNLTAAAQGGAIVLNWNDNGEPDLAAYYVKRSTTSGSGYVKINGTITSGYIDATALPGVTYYYVVTAVDTSANESAVSNEQSAPLYPGDLTLDNRVDLLDIGELGSEWQTEFDIDNLLDIARDWLQGT